MVGHSIPQAVTLLPVAEVSAFCKSVLLAPNRSLPVVMVSHDTYSDRPVVDADEIHASLLGLAQVVLLQDKWASFVLTDILGKQLSCYNGAVRLYWPGLTLQSTPLDHPLFFASSIRYHRDAGQPLHKHLFRKLAAISAIRYAEGTIIREVRTRAEDERRAQLQALREQLHQTADYDKILEESQKILDDNETLRSDRESLRARIRELEDEIITFKENITLMSQHREEGGTEDEGPEPQPSECSTVGEALDRASAEFAESIIVWDSARRSAEDSPFARPMRVYEALMAIHEVCQAHYLARAKSKSIGPWEKAFEQRGFKYAAHESEMTMNLYGKERDFSHQGRRKRMQKHITIGGGDRENCLSIYFDPNDGLRKIDIGYCGLHLQFYNQRT